MEGLKYILTGGFLQGYRTYIVALVTLIWAVSDYALGNIGLMDLIQSDRMYHALTGLGLMSLRAGVDSK
jgi:hypothetical protein